MPRPKKPKKKPKGSYVEEYDPNLTTRGTPRKRYRAPSKKQKQLRAERERLEALGLSGKVADVKKPQKHHGEINLPHRFHIWLSDEEYEYVSYKAFREGMPKSKWIRMVIDTLRMSEGIVLTAE